MDYLEKYEKWCNDSVFDEETKKELLSIKGNENEIRERFYKELEFGTGGLRGIIGAGTNRMNIYTVRKSNPRSSKFYKKRKRRRKGSCDCLWLKTYVKRI